MRQAWEYRVHYRLDPEFAPEGMDVESVWLERMNDLGDDGWEAVALVQELGGRTTSTQGLYASSVGVLMKRSKRD